MIRSIYILLITCSIMFSNKFDDIYNVDKDILKCTKDIDINDFNKYSYILQGNLGGPSINDYIHEHFYYKIDNKYSHIGHDKKNFVQYMFDIISPKYDFFNHLTTFYIDKYWRRKFIAKLHLKNNLKVLDIATGTGDIIINIGKKYTDLRYKYDSNNIEIQYNSYKYETLSYHYL